MKKSREQMVEQAVADYIGEVNYDNALPREAGIDKEGNYYFYLEGIINEDPDGNWDYDEYATGDMPYFKLPLNNNGGYDEIEKICDITSSQAMLLLNDRRYLFGSDGVPNLVEKYIFDAEYEEMSHKFLNMVIDEREPIGMFYTQVESGNYVGVDNSEGDAWTEEFVHFKTLERWFTDGSFSYFTETDKEKYAELDADKNNSLELEIYIGDKEMYAIENNEGWVLDAEADYFHDEYYTEEIVRTLDNKVTSEGLLPLEPNEKGIVRIPEENMIIYNKTDIHVGYPIDYQAKEIKNEKGLEL